MPAARATADGTPGGHGLILANRLTTLCGVYGSGPDVPQKVLGDGLVGSRGHAQILTFDPFCM
ncbi:MAG: hypothetical protein MK130_10455 [Puniceicoccaceae bacterium]|nr:hypothetical protein [Puniceicoccaceae bacterium]